MIKVNKYTLIAICLASFVTIFIILNYVNAKDSVVEPAVKTVSIKIPPPIEGIRFSEKEKAQILKKQPIAILSANGTLHKYIVEVASTKEEKRIGMMHRKYIDENTGMLFSFTEEAEQKFWMKNTFIPLDIIFIRKDGIINYIHHMAEEKSLAPILSNGAVIAVLEIAGGEAEILGINIGDRILYKDF